jgi:N-acetylglutamate synthase-like GNAT family acetyltransferase
LGLNLLSYERFRHYLISSRFGLAAIGLLGSSDGSHDHEVTRSFTAWDDTTLIGFARATSDGVYRATIWDVVVDPNYQGAGIGRKLVQTLITHPRLSRMERIYLMTTNQQTFYKRIGFTENQTTTMVLHSPAFRDTSLS